MDKKTAVIDLALTWKRVKEHKRLYYILLPMTFILSAIYIFSIPRSYTTDTQIVPEMNNNNLNSSSLGSLASSFGIDMTSMTSQDAISPLLYPDLMKDNLFVYHLFSIPVQVPDTHLRCSYYEYLAFYQKQPWWGKLFGAKPGHTPKPYPLGKINPYHLTKEEDKIAKKIRDNISITTDAKKALITITVTDQSPTICKTLADSVRNKLQEYIILYRTNKARTDYAYYKKLAMEAKENYVKTRQKYGSFSDANMDVILESVRAKQNDLENEMQLKYNNYSTLYAKMQAAQAKIQEQTPAFSIIKGAAVPILPSAPKRIIFILVCLFLVTAFSTMWILRHDIAKLFA